MDLQTVPKLAFFFFFFWTVGGICSTWTEPTLTQEEHENFKHKRSRVGDQTDNIVLISLKFWGKNHTFWTVDTYANFLHFGTSVGAQQSHTPLSSCGY